MKFAVGQPVTRVEDTRLITHGHYLIKKRLVTLSDKRKNKYGSFNICQGVMSIKIFKSISRSKLFQFEYFFSRFIFWPYESFGVLCINRIDYFHQVVSGISMVLGCVDIWLKVLIKNLPQKIFIKTDGVITNPGGR